MKTLLIPNRGEIARRIIKTARVCGWRTVVACSEPDQTGLAAIEADEFIVIGPESSTESYLNIGRILKAARDVGATAIHPGYGFLSERHDFSEACTRDGFLFVGPSSESVALLGSKTRAKLLATEIGVPLAPGYFQPSASAVQLFEAAKEIGFPVLIKAAAGGGGRGMRTSTGPEDFESSLNLAREEALRSFGNDEMMVEKLISGPRHIEVQILADKHGTVWPLFERECSIQRRRQKMIEEAGAVMPRFGEAIWSGMKEAAVAIIKASGYSGAGTVEFLVDESTEKFYFLEVNTRLQVEHPITEAITGLDLVEHQLRIAEGEHLPSDTPFAVGNRLAMNGHAIEARIIAENPAHGFMPSTGRLAAFATPNAPWVRVDTGFRTGDLIGGAYDSLLAKLVVHAEDRPRAIVKLRLALLDFHILGVETNISFLLDVVGHPEFLEGRFDIDWLESTFADWSAPSEVDPDLGPVIEATVKGASAELPESVSTSAWAADDGFRVTGHLG